MRAARSCGRRSDLHFDGENWGGSAHKLCGVLGTCQRWLCCGAMGEPIDSCDRRRVCLFLVEGSISEVQPAEDGSVTSYNDTYNRRYV